MDDNFDQDEGPGLLSSRWVVLPCVAVAAAWVAVAVIWWRG